MSHRNMNIRNIKSATNSNNKNQIYGRAYSEATESEEKYIKLTLQCATRPNTSVRKVGKIHRQKKRIYTK